MRIVCHYSAVGKNTVIVFENNTARIGDGIENLFSSSFKPDLVDIVKSKTIPAAEWTNWRDHCVSFHQIVAGRDDWDI